MEKRKRQAVDIEFPLHEDIIHHIQYFLNGRQAAQTSILSKSWYNAWLTRPNLDFDQRDFWHSHRPRSIQFLEIVNKTLQRYEESNQRIEGFRLRMMKSCEYSLTAKLVVKAIRIGAINLDLEFSSNHFKGEFVLPYEVLESETLTSLSLCDCVISLDAVRKLRCWRLKSLSLRNVCLDGNNMMWDILLGCPLIEKLVIYECTFVNEFQNCCDAVWILSLRPSVNPYEFQRLKCLQLEKVHINTLFFRDFSSKFPCLKDLFIRNCYGFEEIAVSSHTLENICFSLSSTGMLKATFDVPRIRNLYFVGSCLSSLTFETVSKDFECHISVSYNKHSPSWFNDLKKLLRNLTLSSRIFLNISTCRADLSENSGDYGCDDQGLPTRVVEHLLLSMKAASLVPCAFLYILFQSCHPKFLTLDLLNCCSTWKGHCDFVKLLCKTTSGNRLYPCFRDLKKVKVFMSFKNGKWQILPLKALLDASTIPTNVKNLHYLQFQFRWER